MPNWLSYILLGAIVVHLILISVCVYRVWRGQNTVDRLIGSDLVGLLFLCVILLLALITLQPLYIDLALGLAALGFIVTLLLAKFIGDGHAE